MKFSGKVVGITKFTEKGRLCIRITLNCGLYFEFSFDEKDRGLYQKFMLADLGTEFTVEVR